MEKIFHLLKSIPLSHNEQYAAHFLVGACLAFWFRSRFRLAVSSCFFLAIGKELIDEVSYGGFDLLDAFFTVSPVFLLLIKKG